MSRRNQDLVSRVRFEVDSRMASASMKALQKESADLNERINEVNASIKALGDVPDDNPALQAYRKQLRGLESDLKDVNTTMKDYTRGVKAAGELYRHYAMGNIEDMSIKAIRAGVNGMKKRYDNLKAGGDPGDAEEMRLIEAITTEADVVVKRFKTDYQNVVEEITRGGTVTEQTLKRTRDGLADLMQTAETEAEKNELTNYWQKVGAAIEAVAVENRRLRGEVADREEAMRIAYATDHDGSQQAIHDAETRADAARRENDELRQRLDLKQQQRRELGDKMENNSIQQQTLMDRRDELKAQEKEDRAIRNQRVDDANKELNAARRAAKIQQQAYDEQKQTVVKLRTEVQGLTDDIRKMGEVKAEPKIDTSKLERQLEEAKRDLAEIAEDERKANEALKQFGITTADITDDAKLQAAAEKALKEEEESRLELAKQMLQVRKQIGQEELKDSRIVGSKDTQAFYAKNKGVLDDEYWKSEAGGGSISRMYKYLNDISDDPEAKAEFKEQVGMTVKDAMRVAGQRMREVVQEAMKRGIKIDDALSDFADGYGHGPATKIEEFMREFNETVGDKEDELIKKRREKLDAIADVVYEPGEEMASRDERLRLAKESLKGVGEGYYGSGKPLSESYKEQQAEVTRLESEMKKLSETSHQSAQSSEQLAQKQEQLSQKTAELNQQQDKLNGMVGETVTANQRLAKAEQEQTDARNAQAEAKKREGEAVKKVEDELRGLTDEQLKNAQAYSHLTEEINTDTAAMQRNITTEQEATREADRLRSGSIDKMEQALARLRESNRKLDPTIDKEEWERGERAIGQLNLRLEELKKQSAELRREPVLDMMTQRMDQLGTLSRDALSETKKFWQAMYDGADNDADKLREIEDNLKRINTEEQKRDRKTLEERAARLQNVDNYSVGELREGIEAAKRLQDQYRLTNDEVQQLSTSIVAAETRIAKVGVEAERQAQRQREQIDLMQQQLSKGSSLTESALKAQENYWQRLADDPKAAAEAVAQYTANMKRAKKLLDDMTASQTKRTAQSLIGDLTTLSEGELRQAIDAAKEYQKTLAVGEDEHRKYSQAIIAAEEHLKEYGLEAERTKVKQEALDKQMRNRMNDLPKLSESALQETKKYWEDLMRTEGLAEQKLSAYRIRLEKLIAEENRRKEVQAERVIGNLNTSSDEEIRRAIQAFEQLRDAQAHGNDEWRYYNERVQEGKRYLDEWAKTDKVIKFEEQMQNLTRLSDAALTETKKFWETMVSGAEKGSSELREYEAHLEKVKQEEQERRQLNDEITVGRLNGDLMNFSTGEIDEAIKAGERLVATYKSGAPEASKLAEKIAAAKEYIKAFGEETSKVAKNQVAEVEGMAALEKAQNGEYATASMDQLEIAIKRIKEYQTLIKDPKGSGAQTFAAAKEQIEALTAQLDALKGKTDKAKAAFQDADEVMQRFSEHMKGTVVTTPGQSIDEQLSQHTSVFDDDIKQAAENVDYYEQQIKEATAELDKMEKELAELEKKHANSSWFRKQTREYKREGLRIEDLRDGINGHDVTMDDGTTFRTGQKQTVEDLKGFKQTHQNYLDYYKQQKAEALGLVEVEEQVQKARRMTREEMQEGIKVLEAEAMAQDRSTADGQKRWEELRKTIGEMNQELKEATGEWMKLADAQKIAEGAGKKGFAASAQEIQQATQALERRREELIKQIRAERDLGNAVDAQEKELDDLTKKLRSLKFEQDNVNMSQEKMRTLIETPAKAVNLDELRAAIKRADGQLRQMEQSLGQNSDEYKRFAEQVRNAKNVMKEMEGQAKASATAWEKAFNRLKTYVVMYMGFNAVWQKVSGTLGDLMQLSDKMGEVGKTTQMTAEQVGKLTDRLRDLDTRTTLVALTELSAKAGQLGLKTEEDILGFTEAANKMLVALPEMGADGATQMMKVALATGEVNRIKKDMDKGLIEGSSATAVAMEKIASTIDQLRANSAAAAPQITDFVKRVGAVGAQSGITIDQVAALGSTVDALGMRVEMSATALSRMIPAIKNNAFEVAKAIGMAPEALRKMFDEAGGGMNAMLAIFQHIKDAGMNPDDIEKMLGMGGMQDIMKDLNQQGARAGIVFAGLSQNVDVLRQHLGIAAEAYEENVAIQQEYDRMSETTVAKWERLKNQFEEMWVGTSANNALGGVIDALRVIVDLISGPLKTAFNATVISVVAIKSGLTSIPAAAGSVFDYLKESAQKAAEDLEKAANATGAISDAAEGVGEAADVVGDIGDALSDAKEAGEQAGEAVESATGAISGMGAASKVSIFSINGLKTAWKGLDTTMKANIIVAVIALLYTLGKAIYDIVTSVDAEKKALAEANQEADRATEKLGVYFDHLKDTTAELDAARKATEGLTAGTDKATEAEVRMTKATDNHRTAIANINQNYSKYLGFMLTEYDRAEMVAAAHNKIAAAIRREILMKQKQASIEENEKKHQDDLSDDWAKIVSQMTEDDRMTGDQAASARLAFRKMLSKSYTTNANGDLVASDELKKSLGSLYNDNASLEQLTAVWMARHLQQNYGLSRNAIKDITGIDYYKSNYGTSRGQYVWTTSKELFGNNLRGDYLGEYFDMQRENAKTGRLYQEDLGATEEDLKESTTTIVGQLKDNINAQISLLRQSDLSAKERNDAYAELARALEGVNENVDELETAEQKQTKQFVTDVLEKNKKFIDSSRLQRARDKIQQGFDAFSTLDTETNNIWGNRLPAESTDWKNMTAEQLVNRRKQMKDFVNAIQTDTDVKAVLEEDKALKKAIEKGMSSDMRTVIEWYNTERLKIQDELHARHLTNTGDWKDPKQQRAAKKQWHDEIDAYLHELDAYYTERKTRIEQARNDEEITEGEAWRRTIQNDNEWQTRRAELQKIYADKSGEVTKEEMDAIYRIISERTGDTLEFVRGTVARTNKFAKDIAKTGEKGAAMIHKWESDMDLSAERSFLKAAQAIGKQMKFIEDTLAKERPYDGITKNLQDNLDKMGVLAAKYRRENEELARQGKEPKYSNEQITAQSYDEMAFYLRQAADAYSIDIDELLRRMVNEGMTATAEEISKSDMLKQAVMGQLRKTYQEVQDAIKKEASQIKKDVEIIWNDDARGIGGMSMKATFDKALAQLGMQQDSVSRANSLIGAGAASDNVASRLAMKQIEVQMRMQKAQYDMYRVQANQRMAALKAEAEEHRRLAKQMEKENHLAESKRELLMATNAERDAENVRLSLGLTLAEETKKEEQQKAELLKIQEESQNRLYTSLREWADLLTSSLQGVFEASHAGDAEYYNELAKLDLTGKGGPGAGTYVVIDDAGTSDATAHYEYLDERQALERQHEIEVQNAQAEAWRKLMDDLNMKMSEQITDWLNAAAQNASVDANTDATLANTEAIVGLTAAMGGKVDTSLTNGLGYEPSGNEPNPTIERIGYEAEQQVTQTSTTESAPSVFLDPNNVGLIWEQQAEAAELSAERQVGAIDKVKVALDDQFHKQEKGSKESSQKMTSSTQSAFAKMTAAANLYGIAYQVMQNDNLSASQKFGLMAVQAAGQAAITSLTVDFASTTAQTAADTPSVLSKLYKQLGWGAIPVFAVFTGLLGGLLGLAASKIAKSKSEIAQATGASVGAGRLATGMLTYAEGNVNELTDPASLTPGRQYNVDGADGKTYRARYMGKGAKTHITNGPEFHLVGEAGREAIIDAKTTRLLQMNETGIWRDIQTLYNGGSISGLSTRRRRGGVRAFADGNIGEFEEMADGGGLTADGTGGMEMEQMLTALDRNSAIQEALLERLNQPIYAQNILYGPDGLPNVINKLNKEAQRHGEKYL